MVDLGPGQSLPGVGGVEAVALGEPVLQCSGLRLKLRPDGLNGAPDPFLWVPLGLAVETEVFLSGFEAAAQTERLVVELRDKLAKLNLNPGADVSDAFVAPTDSGSTVLPVSDVKEEAMSALVALGYKPPQASKAINAVYQDDMSSEALIREALRSMV